MMVLRRNVGNCNPQWRTAAYRRLQSLHDDT